MCCGWGMVCGIRSIIMKGIDSFHTIWWTVWTCHKFIYISINWILCQDKRGTLLCSVWWLAGINEEFVWIEKVILLLNYDQNSQYVVSSNSRCSNEHKEFMYLTCVISWIKSFSMSKLINKFFFCYIFFCKLLKINNM
jgi:hypothetical protein